MKAIIKDKNTGEFYCVPMTEKDRYGNPTTGDNDFPYWSDDINEAVKFDSKLLAEYETKMNDFSDIEIEILDQLIQ